MHLCIMSVAFKHGGNSNFRILVCFGSDNRYLAHYEAYILLLVVSCWFGENVGVHGCSIISIDKYVFNDIYCLWFLSQW